MPLLVWYRYFKKVMISSSASLPIDESMQGMGVGGRLLNYITDFSIKNGGKRLWCNARISAIGFYLKFDFKHTGQLFSKNGF